MSVLVCLSAVASSSSGIQRPVINQAIINHTSVDDHRSMSDLTPENGPDQSATTDDVLDHDVLDRIEVIVGLTSVFDAKLVT